MSRYSEMGSYYERCGDCGGAIGERKVSKRKRVCDVCWDNRGWLLKNYKTIGLAEFQKVQRSMAGHRGTAKRRIEKLKVEVGLTK